MRRVKQRRLRSLDESGINLAMTRLYGRAPRGGRVRESVPRNYGSHTSVISAPGLSGPEAVWTVEGAVDTDVFNVYVERVLRPTIRRGDILVSDNLRAHHASRIEAVAEECGAEVIWLSPYSPDFSPIELMWSKITASLRAARARTREELERALVSALELVTNADCLGFQALRLSSHTQSQLAITQRSRSRVPASLASYVYLSLRKAFVRGETAPADEPAGNKITNRASGGSCHAAYA